VLSAPPAEVPEPEVPTPQNAEEATTSFQDFKARYPKHRMTAVNIHHYIAALAHCSTTSSVAIHRGNAGRAPTLRPRRR
jgi:hypothetical protein